MSKSKYDNAFKLKVYENGTFKKVQEITRDLYYDSCKLYLNEEDGTLNYVMINGVLADWLDYAKNIPSLDCSLRMISSKRRKANKVHQKISKLVHEGNAIFITLTFNDETLAKTSQITRRRYVARYLKDNCSKYVANIDYGAKNGREHYHAVVNSDICFDNWYKYGAIKVERVRKSDTDSQKVSRYITKLTKHALKVENTPRLIYSRSV